MLLSMTGHGDARHQAEGRCVTVEVRTVNNRYFKLSVRGPESYASLESRIESLVRKHIRRGTVNVLLRIVRETGADDFRINGDVLFSYQRQLNEILGVGESDQEVAGLDTLLRMPGVVEEPDVTQNDLELDWAAAQPAVEAAIDSLQVMRQTEGQAMAKDLAENCSAIAGQLDKVEERSPQIIESFQQRMTDRLNKLLAEHDVSVHPTEVIKEVGAYSERCDISEEVVRLRSHLEQFVNITTEPESAGRKLEFVIQEMFREANTIGSKCNDAAVAMHVVEIKTHIERMREMIQNVE